MSKQQKINLIITGIVIGLIVGAIISVMYYRPEILPTLDCGGGYQEVEYLDGRHRCLFLCPDQITFTNDWKKCPKVECALSSQCPAGYVCDPRTFSCTGQCGPAVSCGDGMCTSWCETIDDCPSDCGFLK